MKPSLRPTSRRELSAILKHCRSLSQQVRVQGLASRGIAPLVDGSRPLWTTGFDQIVDLDIEEQAPKETKDDVPTHSKDYRGLALLLAVMIILLVVIAAIVGAWRENERCWRLSPNLRRVLRNDHRGERLLSR